MKAEEFIFEKKKKKKKSKKKSRWAAWGPGPYGGYGYATGYSGDGGGLGDGGGVGEASYPGNIGMMELAKFFKIANDKEKQIFDQLLKKGKKGLAWKLIQDVTGVKLQGKEFDLDEGWRDTLANLGISLAIAGGGTAGLTVKQALNSPDIPPETKAEIVQKANIPKAELSTPIKKEIETAKSVTTKPEVTKEPTTTELKKKIADMLEDPHEITLAKAAIAAGITGTELAAFLAQCAHETHDFKSMVEYGDDRYFRRYDPKYSPKKAKILGNTKAGDGARYKGRGYIQLTGRYNYKRAGEALGLPLEQKPELVEKPEIAAKVAIWFWQKRVQPRVDNFNDVKSVTKPINPRLNGLEDRKENFKDYKLVLAKL